LLLLFPRLGRSGVNSLRLTECVRDGPSQFFWLITIPRVLKAPPFNVEVQVSARIDVLVQVEFSGSAYEHEVLAQFRT
jgi:hypothetical protein